MKATTLILTPAQAKMLLSKLPVNSAITLKVKDANRIINSGKKKTK